MVYATTGHNGQSDLPAGHVLRQAHESPQGKVDICQLVWLTKNTSYENVGGIFLRKNTIDS